MNTLVAILSVLLLVNSGFSLYFNNKASEARRVIKQCEAELPRNQHCKLIAVPKKEAQDD